MPAAAAEGEGSMEKKQPGKGGELVRRLMGFVSLKGFGKSLQDGGDEEKENGSRKVGGWRTMPFIIGNETFERVASFGLTANLTVYLVKRYHMQQVTAVNVNNIWSGTSSFAPLLGAFLADAYWGKFKTVAYGCIATFLGMVVMTLTAGVDGLQPPTCSASELQLGQCVGPSDGQLAVLILAFILLALGGGGVRPCNLPFGIDQFDRTTDAGRKGTNTFFNWYYTTNTAAVMVALTLVVYIQDSVSWTIGFAVPAVLILLATVMFFLGNRRYVYIPPEGSIFSGIAQVIVAALKKRGVKLPPPAEQELVLYNPPLQTAASNSTVIKLPLTQQFSFLNKAASVSNLAGELNAVDGSLAKPWSLSTVQRVEEVKCLIRVIPIWLSGIMCFVAIGQQWTIAVLQSLTMDRHLGPHFEIPPASLGVFSLLAIVLFLPIYDRLLVPILRRITGHEAGITLLQRMGVGILISAFSMFIAGIVELKRRSLAESHGSYMVPMSALWLVPQLVLVGVSEAFNAVGQIEFFNEQFPEQLRSLATSLFWCSQAGAGYLSTIVVTAVHRNTGKHGRPNWLDNNVNAGRVDYYYYLLAVMGCVNLIYFLIVAHFYRYKCSAPDVHPDVHPRDEEEDDDDDGRRKKKEKESSAD